MLEAGWLVQAGDIPVNNINPWLKTDLEKSLKKPECEMETDRDVCLKYLEDFHDLIEKGDAKGAQLKTVHYKIYQSTIVDWARLRYFECDTNLSKMWLKKIYKYIEMMYQASMAMDEAEHYKKTGNFEKAKKIYNDAVDAYIKVIKNPEKPNPRIREQLRIQKFKEHKLYMEYLRKLQKGEAVEE